MKRLCRVSFWTLILVGLSLPGFFSNPNLIHAQPASQRWKNGDGPALQDNAFIWPISGTGTPDVGLISSPFGPRWQASQNRFDFHPGIDITSPLGTPIHAAADGVVTDVGWLSTTSGLAVILDHPGLNLKTAYLHLNEVSVVLNQEVTRGEEIGTVGNTGTSGFTHLHFEIRLPTGIYPNSTRNPMGYLPRPEQAAPTIHITDLQSTPICSPCVTVMITVNRNELDLNQIRVILQDLSTGEVIDNQYVDINNRIHTGSDALDQDGIQLIPAEFHKSSPDYELSAKFYALHGRDSFRIIAQAVDLSGIVSEDTMTVMDTTPPTWPIYLPTILQ